MNKVMEAEMESKVAQYMKVHHSGKTFNGIEKAAAILLEDQSSTELIIYLIVEEPCDSERAKIYYGLNDIAKELRAKYLPGDDQGEEQKI